MNGGPSPGRDQLLIAIAMAIPLIAIFLVHGWAGASLVGTPMLCLLVLKLTLARLARWRRPSETGDTGLLEVCAVMPVHNEDAELAVAGVRSMLAQTRPLQRIHVVDDGSSDEGAAAGAVRDELVASAGDIDWVVTVLDENVGKRAALAVGFRSAPSDTDIFLCVDSDTVLAPDAVAEGLRPFGDPDVSAVTGLVMALNRSRNLLTRLIDLRYVSAFLSERAAYSFFGAVLCCCGSLSFYRAGVIRDNLADFVDQTFLGRTATFGDDRRLTNYALRSGRVELVESSRAQTAVPERFGHYLRQQLRWNKSFIRESVWVLGTFPVGHPAFWLTLGEVIGWLIVGTLTLLAVVAAPFLATPGGLWLLAAVAALAAYARSAVYLENARPGIELGERARVLLLAPLYAVVHVFLLIPLRFCALVTLTRAQWGTRSGGVEVRIAD